MLGLQATMIPHIQSLRVHQHSLAIENASSSVKVILLVEQLALPWKVGNATVFQDFQLSLSFPQEMLNELVVFSVHS